ncbi:ATP-dependent endonuclease [bacterium]|nr:ATP-dependent endonuclease [bacterium]
MRIESIRIQNYKTFGPEGITFQVGNLVAFVGENSVGKSNILEALDIFFNFTIAKVTSEIFHQNNVNNNIEIEIGFYDLNEKEKKTFRSHLEDGRLRVTQKISKIGSGDSGDEESNPVKEVNFKESKHGIKYVSQNGYEWCELKEKNHTKKDITKWWGQELEVGEVDFKTFFDSTETVPLPDIYQLKLETLWEEHADSIPRTKTTGDEKMLGWKNILKGNLPKYFLIPAVRDVSQDLKVTRNSPLGEMLSWFTQGISKEIMEKFREGQERIIKEVIESIDVDSEGSSKIQKINEIINENLGISTGCKLELKFGTPEMKDIVFPSPTIYADDGFESELTRKGNGIQRLAMFSLLRTYHTYNFQEATFNDNYILGIEEPEIYLHPPNKRATYDLLKKLSDEKGQIIYSTHDNCFISIENYDQIRLLRKDSGKTNVYEFSYDTLIQFYKEKYSISVDETSLRQRFGNICDETKNEGFFAKKIIIVEGATEKYSLPIYFDKKGYNINQNQVVIIEAGSVDNISYIYLIFNEFHIPCYVIFDGDKSFKNVEEMNKDELMNTNLKSERNKKLFELLNIEYDKTAQYFFPDTTIGENCTVWNHRFETEVQQKLENYNALKSEAKKMYSSDSKPLTARYIAKEICSKYSDKIPREIDTLISRIKNSKWDKSCTT